MIKKKCILTYVIVEVEWLYLLQLTPVLESKYGSTENGFKWLIGCLLFLYTLKIFNSRRESNISNEGLKNKALNQYLSFTLKAHIIQSYNRLFN